MKNSLPKFSSFVFGTFFLLNGINSHAEVDCSVVLTTKAFDTSSSKSAMSILTSSRASTCSQEYNSESEANAAAQSLSLAGKTPGYKLSGQATKNSSNSKYTLKESSYCTDSAQAFQAQSSSEAETVVASAAVAAWLACTESTNAKSQLYIEYHKTNDNQSVVGTLYRKTGDSEANGEITGISAVGRPLKESGIDCNIDNIKVPVNTKIEPIPINKRKTSVICTKEKKEISTEIIVNTTSSPSGPMIMPSDSEINAAKNVEIAPTLLKSAHGSIDLVATNTRPIDDSSLCVAGTDNFRGTKNKNFKFIIPFDAAPSVSIGISNIVSNLPKDTGLRLSISVSNITRFGFDYTFGTYCNTSITAAQAEWIAVSR